MEGDNSKSVSLVKETVCKACMSVGITYLDCVCTYMKNYPTIELEFEQCNCCGTILDSNEVPDTEFNRQQLGNEFFNWNVDEYIESLKKSTNDKAKDKTNN